MSRILALVLMVACALSACRKDETYAEQKEKERDAVKAFLGRDVVIRDAYGDTAYHVGRIKVIDEATFYAQDSTTDVSKNEYVFFSTSGVYMQIRRKGGGEKMKHGDQKYIIPRFIEFNILTDTLINSNRNVTFANYPDIMNVTCSYGNFTASFDMSFYGTGAMYSRYGSTAVPSGWLVPLNYVNIGGQNADGIAHVRLIVPHSQGTSQASSSVYPCFYDITLQEKYNN